MNIERFFSRELLVWYEGSKRDLPWRRHRDPYYIWVSEIMLQQTRVDTVIPYFHRFIERFPTIADLAEAPEEEVLKCWEGLGYYSRARNLQQAAKQVAERHGGKVPDDKASVSALKGVGPYTAGAILSIAFGQPEPAVDGNVMRVLSRYFLIEDDIMKPATRTRMEVLAARLIPEGRASDFNQALMELGALVCTPKSPHCLTCPVMEHCQGRLAGAEERLPVKTKAKPPRPEYRLAALVEGAGGNSGRVLVRRRGASGLLARMWELPHVPAADGQPGDGAGLPDEPAMDRLAHWLAAEGTPARPMQPFMEAEHTFSHIHWNLRVFRFRQAEAMDASRGLMAAEASAAYEAGGLPAPAESPPETRWITREDMAELAFPNVFLRILNRYFDELDRG
ncbi:A/G-specific adenine glycosylase [Paenibacillus caui]|uniref:A/G-specific adenine glycosylase n=1 Tax=Paenibacillus caui TaxID=2873927 RepID=UPI001CA9824B|nr:A/G-specific adenine glycosylase [Paenibacillus caui]